MEEPLKSLMEELGNAINDALSDSTQIAEAIGEIKRAGYDVFLVLEATIGFNKRDEEVDEEVEGDEERQKPDTRTDSGRRQMTKRHSEPTGRVKFNTQDQRFLKALKIAVDDESR